MSMIEGRKAAFDDSVLVLELIMDNLEGFSPASAETIAFGLRVLRRGIENIKKLKDATT